MAAAGSAASGSSDIDRALRENESLIAAILSQQNAAPGSASGLLDRLQANLAYVSALAEVGPGASPPPPPGPAPRTAAALAPAGPVPPTPEAPGYGARWSDDERARLFEAWPCLSRAGRDGRPNYRALSEAVGTKTPAQVRAHVQKNSKRRGRLREGDAARVGSPASENARPGGAGQAAAGGE